MSDLTGRRPTWAEINLDNLVHNFRVTKQAVGPDVAIMAAVKADAYGHGAVQCALALEEAGAAWFGVALPEEGLLLRDAGVSAPILCLGGHWQGQEELLIARGLTPTVFRMQALDQLNKAARAQRTVVQFHLKVDTGMGRLGVPRGEVDGFLDDLGRFENVRLDGVMTHLASADCEDKNDFTKEQIEYFEAAVDRVRSRGHKPRWIHAANSAGTHAFPRSRGTLVRLGGVLYGLWRDVTRRSLQPLDWLPVMSLHSRIMLLKSVPSGSQLGYGGTFVTTRESRIATVAIGYDDGLRRELSNRGRVIVRGQLAPIVGRISMDMTLIDITEIEDAAVGDEVVLIGSLGAAQISAEEVAAQIGTISYEVTCAISGRVPRVYLPEPRR